MRSNLCMLGVAIVLGVGSPIVGALGIPEAAIAQQQQMSEIDRAGEEGIRLFNEGSAESLKKAIERFEKVLMLARSAKIQDRQAFSLLALGRVNDKLGETSKAINYYNQALPIFRALGDQLGEAATFNSIGLAYNALGEKQKALDSYRQALPLNRSVGDRLSEAATLNNIGLAYNALGEKQKALDFHHQALPLYRAVGDRAGEAATLNNLSFVYNNLGEKQKALDFYGQALLLYRAVGDRVGEAMMLNNLGSVYSDSGEKQKALDFYSQALPLSRAVGNRSGEATTLNNIGLVYDTLGEKQKALDFYNQALPLSRAVGDRSGEATTLNNIGLVYDDLGEKQKALDFYNQALPLYRSVGNRSGQAATLNNIGIVYKALGEKQKALDFYNQSLPLTRAVGDRSGEAKALNNIGDVIASQEQPELAIVFYKQSINLYEDLRKDIRKLPRETQEIYTSSVAKTYRQLADTLLKQGRIREAQSILELLKVQESQGYGKDQDANIAPIQFPLHPLETQALQAIEKSIASKSLTQDTLNPIAQPLTQNRDRITQDMNAMPIAIGNPQAVLKANPNALLIQNLVVGDKLWVLWTNVSGNTKAIVIPNIDQKELTTTVETFYKQIGSPYSNLNQLKVTSQKLHNWLLPAELQAELKQNPKQQLIFSLDHVTRYIPVAALYDGNQYLAQRYTLSNLITMDIDVRDRLSPDGSAPTILGLGTTKSYGGFTALPNVEAELKAIVKDNAQSNTELGLYPGKIQLNEAFTANSLSQLDPYRVLHIATHGSFNSKSITASFLLLGNGDRLPITSIASLKNLTNTHLVVLSACETGLSGAGQDGTEISGIGGYFLRRGAKSVLASLWSVNDASTALLMQQFYQTLSQTKLTKAQALQKVQQDFIAGKFTTKEATTIRAVRPRIDGQSPPDSFAHPYFWAPFTLTGNPN